MIEFIIWLVIDFLAFLGFESAREKKESRNKDSTNKEYGNNDKSD